MGLKIKAWLLLGNTLTLPYLSVLLPGFMLTAANPAYFFSHNLNLYHGLKQALYKAFNFSSLFKDLCYWNMVLLLLLVNQRIKRFAWTSKMPVLTTMLCNYCLLQPLWICSNLFSHSYPVSNLCVPLQPSFPFLCLWLQFCQLICLCMWVFLSPVYDSPFLCLFRLNSPLVKKPWMAQISSV